MIEKQQARYKRIISERALSRSNFSLTPRGTNETKITKTNKIKKMYIVALNLQTKKNE